MNKNISMKKTVLGWVAALLMSAAPCALHAQINPAVMPKSGTLSAQSISRLLLTDVTRIGARLVAVGDRGYIVYSDNNGESWQRAEAPENLPLLTGIYVSAAKVGWAVGHDSVILVSRDEGKTWSKAFAAPDDQKPLMDVAFVDANAGFAVGAYGAFYDTTDGGKSWVARKIGSATADGKSDDRHFNAIVRVTDSRYLIAGEAGTLLRSDDAGKTWVSLASPYKGSFFGGITATDGSVIVFGLRGRIYRSSDADLATWVQIPNASLASVMGATKLADGALVLSGLAGTLLVSRDNGQSFTAIKTGTTKALAAPAASAASGVIVVGESGPRAVVISAAPISAAPISK